jgi:hypothetical protein
VAHDQVDQRGRGRGLRGDEPGHHRRDVGLQLAGDDSPEQVAVGRVVGLRVGEAQPVAV